MTIRGIALGGSPVTKAALAASNLAGRNARDGGLNVSDGTPTPAASVTKSGVDRWTTDGGIEDEINPSWGAGEYRHFDRQCVRWIHRAGDTFQHQLTVI